MHAARGAQAERGSTAQRDNATGVRRTERSSCVRGCWSRPWPLAVLYCTVWSRVDPNSPRVFTLPPNSLVARAEKQVLVEKSSEHYGNDAAHRRRLCRPSGLRRPAGGTHKCHLPSAECRGPRDAKSVGNWQRARTDTQSTAQGARSQGVGHTELRRGGGTHAEAPRERPARHAGFKRSLAPALAATHTYLGRPAAPSNGFYLPALLLPDSRTDSAPLPMDRRAYNQGYEDAQRDLHHELAASQQALIATEGPTVYFTVCFRCAHGVRTVCSLCLTLCTHSPSCWRPSRS